MTGMTPDSARHGSSTAKAAKATEIVLLIACLVAAGVVVYCRLRSLTNPLPGDGQLDTPESASLYLCPLDGTMRSVTPAAFDRMLASGEVGAYEGMPPGSPGLYVRCPQCGKRVMALGERRSEEDEALVGGKEGPRQETPSPIDLSARRVDAAEGEPRDVPEPAVPATDADLAGAPDPVECRLPDA